MAAAEGDGDDWQALRAELIANLLRRRPLDENRLRYLRGQVNAITTFRPVLGRESVGHLGRHRAVAAAGKPAKHRKVAVGPDDDDEPYAHPYEDEIKNLSYRPDQLLGPEPAEQALPQSQPRQQQQQQQQQQYKGAVPCAAAAASAPGYQLISTPEQLAQLAEVLRGEREFGIDLEAHSERSFLGFTCLVQISTRAHDYLVDALALWPLLGKQLAEPFADPDIVKVMHGAGQDIMWLQRDFGVYVVNLFDTQAAAQVLGLERLSLTYLLQHFCGIAETKGDKRFQRADWSRRPLSKDMLAYAVKDSHHLLHIYDGLRRLALAEKFKPAAAVELPCRHPDGSIALVKTHPQLAQILQRGQRIALSVWEPPSAARSAAKLAKGFESREPWRRRLLETLNELRFQHARESDLSIGLLSNRDVVQICNSGAASPYLLRRLPARLARRILAAIQELQPPPQHQQQ